MKSIYFNVIYLIAVTYCFNFKFSNFSKVKNTLGSGEKRKNQSIASRYLQSLGTIKETFEELYFLEKQLLVSEGFIVWKPW